MSRVLYASQVDVTSRNGNLQRQAQVLRILARAHPGNLDVLSLQSTPAVTRAWAEREGLTVKVLEGPFAARARRNARAWYYGHVIACNRLRVLRHFGFPLTTPLPREVLDGYAAIVSFYAWPWFLLGLERAGARAVVDLNDVMASRHERIGQRRWISLSPADERRLVTSTARCVAISSGDQDLFARIYGVKLPVAPFVPAQSDALLAVAARPGPRAVGFLGGRGHSSEDVLPLLASDALLGMLAQAGAKLVLAGTVCEGLPADLRQRLDAAGAEILGPVACLSEFYDRVGVVLNPVGPSTGIKVKSVEALLAGRPLVTTVFGGDDALRQGFGDRIRELGWPPRPEEMAQAAIAALELAADPAAAAGARAAAAAYVARSERTAAEVFRP